MKLWERIKESKVAKWYLISLMVIVLLSSISFVVVYNVVYTNNVRQNYLRAENSASEFDADIQSILVKTQTVFDYPLSVKLMSMKQINVEDYVDVRDYREFLDASYLNSDLLANYYVYFPKSQLLLDKQRIYFGFEELWGKFDQITGVNLASFKDDYLFSREKFFPFVEMTIGNAKKTTVFPIRISDTIGNNCIIIAFIDGAVVKQYLSGEMVSYHKVETPSTGVLYDDGVTQLMNSNKIDFVSGTQERLSFGSQYTAFEVYSLAMNGTITLVTNSLYMRSLMSQLISRYVWLFVAVTIVACLLYVILDFKMNAVYHNISRVYTDQKPYILNYHTTKLLDPTSNESSVNVAIKYFNLDSHKWYCVCVLTQLKQDSSVPEWQRLLFEKIKLALKDVNIINYVNKASQLVLILNYKLKDEVQSTIMQVVSKFDSCKGAEIAVGFGEAFSDARGICVSYEQATKVIEFKIAHQNNDISFYNDLPAYQDIILFDIEAKNKVAQAIANNEPDRAKVIFKQVFDAKCRSCYILNPIATNIFVAQSTGILIQSIREIVWDKEKRQELLSEVSKLFDITQPNDFLVAYNFMIEEICSCIVDKDDKEKVQIEKMLNYIEQNYNDCDMSLTKLSDVFNMNECYISQFFKQKTGFNFSQYLENLRIKHACELIKESDKTINQIVVLVGYANRNTFYKAFMRVYGVSPKIYKEHIVNDIFNGEDKNGL